MWYKRFVDKSNRSNSEKAILLRNFLAGAYGILWRYDWCKKHVLVYPGRQQHGRLHDTLMSWSHWSGKNSNEFFLAQRYGTGKLEIERHGASEESCSRRYDRNSQMVPWTFWGELGCITSLFCRNWWKSI